MKRLTNQRSIRSTKRTGATAVEMAMTLPLLMLMLFATYELTRVNMMFHTAEAAAYEGARLGIVPGATNGECEQAVRDILGTAGIKNADVTINPSNLATESESVVVTVSVSYHDNTLMFPMFMGKGARITKTCELVREN